MQSLADFFNSTLTMVLFTASPLLAIYLTAVFLIRRNRKRSISPLTEGLLRGPGHSLRLKFEDLILDSFGLATIIVFSSIMIGREAIRTDNKHFFILFAFVIGVIIAFTTKLFQTLGQARNIKLGMEAEIACGQELVQLMREGWYVFHDIPVNKGKAIFNIDHILIGPSGVFAVETKGRRKPLTKDGKKQHEARYRDGYIQFPNGRDSKTIEQAQRGAKYVSEWLSKACGFRINAIPVLLFPGWFIERDTKPPFPLGNPKNVVKYIQNNPNKIFSEQQCTQISHQVEQAARLPVGSA